MVLNAHRYFDELHACLQAIPSHQLEALVESLQAAFCRRARLFIAGNGGSAATASHLACDLSKTLLGRDPRAKKERFQVISLADNIALFSAWANDEGYEHVFAEQLKTLAFKGDLLLVISASGNSPNILRALETARDLDMQCLGLLGFGGGRARALIDSALVIDSNDYGLVEGAHSVLCHLLTKTLQQALEETPGPGPHAD